MYDASCRQVVKSILFCHMCSELAIDTSFVTIADFKTERQISENRRYSAGSSCGIPSFVHFCLLLHNIKFNLIFGKFCSSVSRI
jgi:hypothetical protein